MYINKKEAFYIRGLPIGLYSRERLKIFSKLATKESFPRGLPDNTYLLIFAIEVSDTPSSKYLSQLEIPKICS